MRGALSTATRESLREAAGRFKAAMVNSDLNLLASDACSVSGIEGILETLCPLFRHVSVKSLSVSSLVRRPESFRLLQKLAKHEFTFGVEGLSARLRAYLGKPATAGDLIQIAGSLAHGGLRYLEHGEIGLVFESVSERKNTRLGPGHFITWVTTYRVGDEVVGRQMFRMLKFKPDLEALLK